MPPIPVWLAALIAAAAAPWCVKALQLALQARARRRTLQLLRRSPREVR